MLDGGVSFLNSAAKSSAVLVAAAALVLVAVAARAQRASVSGLVQREHQGPLDVTGRNFTYDYKTNTFVVTGNAAVRQQASLLTADEIDLVRGTRQLHARGQVHLVDPLGEISAREGRINLGDETAQLTDATITDHNHTYRLEGARVRKLTGQRYSILDGLFTSCACGPGTPDWTITARQMDVHVGNSGTAHGAFFNVLGYPVLYSPYLVFPAGTTRQSGLLSPRIGESGLRGFQFLQPYYWDIDRSSDATFAADLETSQRVGLLGEYRLTTGENDYVALDAAYYNESMRSEQNRLSDIIDPQLANPDIPINRYDVIGQARQNLTDNLLVYGDALSVSDSLELREMNTWTLSRTTTAGIYYPNDFYLMRNAVSDLGVIDSYENGYLQVGGIYNQDLIQPERFALQTLPEILLSGRKELLGGLLYADYDFTGDNFHRTLGQSGLRLDLNPRLTLPWRLGDYLYGFGTLGLRETMYDTSGHVINIIPVGSSGRLYNNALTLGPLAPGGFQSRELIYGSTGVATEIEKVYDLNWGSVDKLKHTVEPFATYTYVPDMNQGGLPLFDETDRIEGRSLLLYGATSRIFLKLSPRWHPYQAVIGADGESEAERGGINPFRPSSFSNGSPVEELLRFTVLQAYDTAHAVAKGSSRFSDLELTATMFPTRIWSMGGQFGYSPQASTIHYASFYLNFEPWWTNNTPRMYMGKATVGSFLQLSYNYIGEGPDFQPGVNAAASQFMTLRAYYELFNRLGVFFAPSYDFTTHQLLSAAYGVRIKSPCDCWAFDFGITDTTYPSETQFQFQLTLGGLGSIGQTPFGRNPFQLHTSVLPGLL